MVRSDDNKAVDPKVKVEQEEKVEYDTSNFSWPPLPPEWWELQELVQNECPAEALKAFRKSVIGKKNPLTAAQADNAIAGASKACETGKIVDKRRTKRIFVPETIESKMARMHWYAREGIPVCFARPYGHEWTEEEMEFISDHEAEDHDCALTFLSFDDTGVDRTFAP
jgi:hypothetical protein